MCAFLSELIHPVNSLFRSSWISREEEGTSAGARYAKWITSPELRHKKHNNDL